MRAVVQRVKWAKVEVLSRPVGEIGPGLLILLAVNREDTIQEVKWLARKIVSLRIFSDSEDKLNLSLKEVDGQVLVVSQFTLYGDCRKGCRPSYTHSAPPEVARRLYQEFIDELRTYGCRVQQGEFQAHMEVSLLNHGPVTIIVDTPHSSKEGT